MSRLRWRTLAMSVVTGAVIVPNCGACCARWATRALQISFLLGMQAMLGQEPPTQRRSTTAVRRPDPAMCQASSLPPWPLPAAHAVRDLGLPEGGEEAILGLTLGLMTPRMRGMSDKTIEQQACERRSTMKRLTRR